MGLARLVGYHYPVPRSLGNDPGGLGEHHLPAVPCDAALEARAHQRGLRAKQRHRLPLHVRAHQGPVGVVMLQERDQGRRHADQLHGRYVHEADVLRRLGRHAVSYSRLHPVAGELAGVVELRRRLRDVYLLLVGRRQVDDVIHAVGDVRLYGNLLLGQGLDLGAESLRHRAPCLDDRPRAPHHVLGHGAAKQRRVLARNGLLSVAVHGLDGYLLLRQLCYAGKGRFSNDSSRLDDRPRAPGHVLRNGVAQQPGVLAGNGRLDATVGRLKEAVLVRLGICGHGAEQADVRALRRFDRADAPVVRVVDVADVEAGALPRQAAGAQRGQPALVRELVQGVRLLHELRQLRAPEEFPDSRDHGTDVDQRRRSRLRRVHLRGHPLLDDALHPQQPHADLLLDQLSHRAHPPVAQVVYVVPILHIVVDLDHRAYETDDVVPVQDAIVGIGFKADQWILSLHSVTYIHLSKAERAKPVFVFHTSRIGDNHLCIGYFRHLTVDRREAAEALVHLVTSDSA